MKNYLYALLCPFLIGLTACSTNPKGIANLRDLGAYSISDSLHIRSGLLLRSANLADATDEELQNLAALPVTKIIDFRTEPEKTGQTDRLVAGAEYVALPVDVSRDTTAQAMAEEEQQRSSGKKFDIRKMIVMVAFNEQAQQIARTGKTIDLLSIALTHGYYDLSHMALEFQQMGCVSPSHFRALGIPLSDDFSVFFA